MAVSMEKRVIWRRRGKRVGLGLAITTAAIGAVGFLAVPPIARHLAQSQLTELLGRQVKIERIRFNPFALSLTIEGLQVMEADHTRTFVGFSRLYVNAQLSSIFRRGPVLREIRLESPRIHVVRTKATDDAWSDLGAAYNFSDILARLAARPAPPESPKPAAGLPRFALSNIRIVDGMVTFEDQPLGERHVLSELTVGVPFVSTLPVDVDSFVEPGLGFRVDGTPFVAEARTKPFQDSLETVLELRLSGLDLTRYVSFVPMRLGFTVDSARLSLALDVAFVRRGEQPSLVVNGDVALEKVALREKRRAGPAPLLALEKLAVAIGRSNVTAQQFQIDRVSIAGLEVHARRLADGTLSLQHLLPPPDKAGRRPDPAPTRAPPPAKGKGEDPLRFAVGELALEKATVFFQDESVRPAFQAKVEDIALVVKGLSNAPGAAATVSAGLRSVPGGTVTHRGTLRLAPLSARGAIAIEGVEPAELAPYYRERVGFEVASGRLRLGTEYTFEEGKGAPTVRTAAGFLAIADLALRRRGARDDVFRLPSFSVEGAALDLAGRSIAIAKIATQGGRVRAVRDAAGVVDLTTLAAPPAGASPGEPPSSGDKPGTRSEEAPGAAPAGPPWKVALRSLEVGTWSVRFEDRALRTKAVVTIDPIAIAVTDFSTAPGAKMALELRLGLNRTGRFEVKGSAVLDPLAANLRFDLRRLDLVPLAPYLGEQLALAVTGGQVSLRGRTAIERRPGRDTEIEASADLEVSELATLDSADQEPLVGWKSLRVSGIRFASRPPAALAIGEVALSDLNARVISHPDGTMNLQRAFAPPASPARPGKPPRPAGKAVAAAPPPGRSPASGAKGGKAETAAAPTVKVGKVTLERAQITFQDRTVRPAFTAEITDLGGQVSGLSSVPGTTAEVAIEAAVNRTGALAISGKVNPLAEPLFLDIEARLRDVELPPATPYSGKYAGLTIRKGKLGLALDYEIANRKLAAKNRLLVDQLAFGEKVDSPDATKLPVRLAVALLRDRHGLIDVTLPIEGSLDDPEFKIWGAVLKVIGNLLVKAATSPFSLIASAFGGGDELSQVAFPAGASDLDDGGKKRIATLGKVLLERPGLSLELGGQADPRRDGEGLKRFLVERKVKVKKLAALVEEGIAVTSPDGLVIEPAERERFTREAYDGEGFEKPRNALGFKKRLPVPEMEKLMVANTRVTDEDLRALALRRATAVQAALAKTAPGTSARLFLVSPRVSGGGGHVEIKLKD